MEKINFREEYQMAFQDLEGYLKPEVFSYLLTQLNVGMDNQYSMDEDKIISKLLKNRQEDISPVESSESSSLSSLQSSSSEPSILPHNLPEELVKIKKRGGRGGSESSSTLLPSLSSQSRQSLLSASVGEAESVSFGPNVPRKFPHQKGGTLDGRSRKSQSRPRKADEFKRNLSTPYDSLVGKINQSEPPLFDRGRKLPKPPRGVREFGNPVSNPLYKNYNPKGIIKNEDEIAREFITEITHNFNDWLRSFDAGLNVQLDPDMMIKILRDDMELSFGH